MSWERWRVEKGEWKKLREKMRRRKKWEKKLRERKQKKVESKKKWRKKMEPNVVGVFSFFFVVFFLMFIFKLLAFRKLEKIFEIIINKNTLQ